MFFLGERFIEGALVVCRSGFFLLLQGPFSLSPCGELDITMYCDLYMVKEEMKGTFANPQHTSPF